MIVSFFSTVLFVPLFVKFQDKVTGNLWKLQLQLQFTSLLVFTCLMRDSWGNTTTIALCWTFLVDLSCIPGTSLFFCQETQVVLVLVETSPMNPCPCPTPTSSPARGETISPFLLSCWRCYFFSAAGKCHSRFQILIDGGRNNVKTKDLSSYLFGVWFGLSILWSL